jgi:hypothetical protein
MATLQMQLVTRTGNELLLPEENNKLEERSCESVEGATVER